jgi:hypothetical protein
MEQNAHFAISRRRANRLCSNMITQADKNGRKQFQDCRACPLWKPIQILE